MAKRKHRRGTRGFGNIISVRKGVDGLFDTGTVVGDALPVVLGGLLAVGTTVLVRKMVPTVVAAVAPATGAAGFGTLSAGLVRFAPLLGMAVGSLAGLGLVYGAGKRTAGTAMMASAVTVGGAVWGAEKLSGVAGFGAIVPEYGMMGLGANMPIMPGGVNGLGATVLENWPAGQRPDSIGALGDAYGTSINLSGLGQVNTSAFGTPGFSV